MVIQVKQAKSEQVIVKLSKLGKLKGCESDKFERKY